MSCWTRHIVDVMGSAGVEVSKENKKKIDKYVREKYKLTGEVKCPEVWKEYVKPILADEKKKGDFTAEIKKIFS